MLIINYFQDDRQAHWLAQIRQVEWRAARLLEQLLNEGTFHQVLGRGTLFLLTAGDALVSFLTLAERDCIDDASLAPWIGFVHTSPAYRGRRCAGLLLEHAVRVAGKYGAKQVYICTDHVGLYEKYGFVYVTNRLSIYGEDSRVLVRRTTPIAIRFAEAEDLPQWMALVRRVAWNFPGLETEESLLEHEATVAKFIGKGNAICAVADGKIAGVLLFSRRLNQLCCMAVDPDHRRLGAATGMLRLMDTIADPARDVRVITFREGDPLGIAARAFYAANGFIPAEMVAENGHPCQVFIRRAINAQG